MSSLDPAADGIRGTVRHRENLGSDLFVHVETAGEHRIIARSAPEIVDAVPPGATVTLRPRPDRALLFDRAGRRAVTTTALPPGGRTDDAPRRARRAPRRWRPMC